MIIAGIPKAFCLTNCLSPLRKIQNQRQLMSCLFGTLNVISHVKMCSTQLDLAVGNTKHFGKFILHPSQTRCCGVWVLRTNQYGTLLPRGRAPCLRSGGAGRYSCQSAAVVRETWGPASAHPCTSSEAVLNASTSCGNAACMVPTLPKLLNIPQVHRKGQCLCEKLRYKLELREIWKHLYGGWWKIYCMCLIY